MASSRAQRYCLCLEVKQAVSYKPVLEKPVLSTAEGSDTFTAVAQINPFPQTTIMAANKDTCAVSLSSPIRFEVLDLFHWLSAGMTSFERGLNDAPKIAALAFGIGSFGTHLHSRRSTL